MSTKSKIWFGILVSALLFSLWLFIGFFLSSYLQTGDTSPRVGLFLGILGLQVATAAAIFYTASKVALYRYEVIFQERLREQIQEMNRGIEEMKGIVREIDSAFRERSQALTREVASAIQVSLDGKESSSLDAEV